MKPCDYDNIPRAAEITSLRQSLLDSQLALANSLEVILQQSREIESLHNRVRLSLEVAEHLGDSISTIIGHPLNNDGDSLIAAVDALKKDNTRLNHWRTDARKVLDAIDFQVIGQELGLGLGEEVSTQILPGIQKLKSQLKDLSCAEEEAREFESNQK